HSTGEPPDPMSEATFNDSRLQWELVENEPHKNMLRYYKELIALRKSFPALYELDRKQLYCEEDVDAQTILLRRSFADQHLICLMNFSDQSRAMLTLAYEEGWKKVFDSADARWGGMSQAPLAVEPGMEVTVQPESILIYKN
ncbi:MAG TPA: DUF3459 domain-containing protein, partial [Flavipsychrobacter sp.]|nr:DUF3459 domain-containing protein [Flavipsychrobacter sp.]